MPTLGVLLSELTALGPDRPAVTCGDATMSFGELDARAARAAQWMHGVGVRPGDRVAVLARNRPEFFELLFGAARAGAVLTALNWRLAAPEIAEIIADAEPALVLADAGGRALLPAGLADRVVDLDGGYRSRIAGRPTDPPAVTVEAGDVVLQLYSSGTTGRPKGALLTHANLAFTPRMGREFYRMDADTVNMVASPLFHIGGIGYALTALGQGGHTVLMTEVDPAAMVRDIATHRVTHGFFVPAVVTLLLDAARRSAADLSSLRTIAYGGAPMTEALLRRAMAALPCAFLGVYGMTETAGSVTSLAPGDHDPGGGRAGLLRSVGRALPWCEVAVFDPLTGAPLPTGEVGEVWVRSGQNTPGYWRRPEETAEAITAEGWLRTGDGAYTDADGFLFLHDRIKDMVISGGENVYPAEVENALAGHPGVADVAVIGVPSARWGETVLAVVVAAPGTPPSPAGLIEHARARLAPYKCPTGVEFVEALPRNAAGKVLKRVLRESYRGQA